MSGEFCLKIMKLKDVLLFDFYCWTVYRTSMTKTLWEKNITKLNSGLRNTRDAPCLASQEGIMNLRKVKN